MFQTLFDDISECKDLFSTSPTFSEACLLFTKGLVHCILESVEQHSGEDLAWR